MPSKRAPVTSATRKRAPPRGAPSWAISSALGKKRIEPLGRTRKFIDRPPAGRSNAVRGKAERDVLFPGRWHRNNRRDPLEHDPLPRPRHRFRPHRPRPRHPRIPEQARPRARPAPEDAARPRGAAPRRSTAASTGIPASTATGCWRACCAASPTCRRRRASAPCSTRTSPPRTSPANAPISSGPHAGASSGPMAGPGCSSSPAELRACTRGPRWSAALRPLADIFAERFLRFLPRPTYPVRAGAHSNTAFALALAADYAPPGRCWPRRAAARQGARAGTARTPTARPGSPAATISSRPR